MKRTFFKDRLGRLISTLLSKTPLGYIPVRVQHGPAKGARWTLGPFSSNWRHGGEQDLTAGLALLRRNESLTCWDFGAHFGIHTVGMAFHVGRLGQVLALEPDPIAFRRLRYHVSLNGLTNVTLLQAAASETTEEGEMILTNGMGSSCSHFQYEEETVSPDAEIIRVRRVVPDRLVHEGKIRTPNLIKVDVQGHGAHALRGSERSIRTARPLILFSNHSAQEIAGARAVLEPIGYHVQNLAGDPMEWEQVAIPDTVILAPNQRQA
jgi:FkbM family methyltransferase